MTVAFSLIRCSHPPARSLPDSPLRPACPGNLGKIFLPGPTLDYIGRRPYKAASWLARNTEDVAHVPLQG